jgi:HEAT repeat protein
MFSVVPSCAGRHVRRLEGIRRDPVLAQLASQVEALDEAGYEGGLTAVETTLAEALAARALETGVPNTACKHRRELGSIVVSGHPSTDSGRTDHNPVVDLLEHVIRSGRRKQRDVALLAVTRIGPGSGFSQAFLQERGAWSRAALTSVTCERWSHPDVFEMWSPVRAAMLNRMAFQTAAPKAIELMIQQMVDKRFNYPADVFSSTLVNRGYGNHLTVDSVRQLLPILRDSTYRESVRLEAVEFVRVLGRATWLASPEGQRHDARPIRRLRGQEHLFDDDLWNIYRGSSPVLVEAAGRALIEIRSVYGADVLANLIESKRADHWTWSISDDCDAFKQSERLARALLARVADPIEADRIEAIKGIGCLTFEPAIPSLLEALSEPFWSQQEAVALALARFPVLPPDAISALQEAASNHWSANVRTAAKRSLDPLRGLSAARPDGMEMIGRLGFHRKAIRHGLAVCHGNTPGNGRYAYAGHEPFDVVWEVAKVHDLPKGFPVRLDELRFRKGYGTNTFLREEGGWLYSTDLWHYGGELGFASDDGKQQPLAPESAHAAFLIRTEFGITALGDDVVGGGYGGVLAVLDRKEDGTWRWTPLLELPSEAFAHAFAPNGTLLVADPFGAVAITKDRKILPLECR